MVTSLNSPENSGKLARCRPVLEFANLALLLHLFSVTI